MNKISISKLLLLLLVFALMWSCKKKNDDPNIDNTPPAPELRQASLEANISGDYTDSFVIHKGSDYPDENITAQFTISDNFLTIQTEQNTSAPLSFQFIAGISSLEIGIYALIVGENESVGLYSNENIPTGALELVTGILNITSVDAVPSELAGSNTRYVSGTFSFNMVDDVAGASVEAEGSFTDVLVLMY